MLQHQFDGDSHFRRRGVNNRSSGVDSPAASMAVLLLLQHGIIRRSGKQWYVDSSDMASISHVRNPASTQFDRGFDDRALHIAPERRGCTVNDNSQASTVFMHLAQLLAKIPLKTSD